MFLHSGWGHLLGNMVFLFLFGFTLEGVLGKRLYITFYLASGIAASGLYALLNSHSFVPLVGASGAISGLMGMYLALYRLRKIRFFYTVLFYFGEFQAPALLVLPLWLGKEFYGYFFIESNVAYWAHIGGLMAGAGLLLIARQTRRNFAATERAAAEMDSLEKGLTGIQISMSQMNYDRARAQARILCSNHPEEPSPWRALFNINRLQPQQTDFHQDTTHFLQKFIDASTDFRRWRGEAEGIIEEYQSLTTTPVALSGDCCLALAQTYWRHDMRIKAEHYLQRSLSQNHDTEKCDRFIADCVHYYRKQGQTKKANRLLALQAK